MSVRSVLLLLAATAAVPLPASADQLDHSLAQGELLQQSCSSEALALRAMCLGYLAAVADDLDRDQRVGGPRICAPHPVNLDAYRLAFLGFAQSNPAQLEQPSFDLVKKALVQAWPCR